MKDNVLWDLNTSGERGRKKKRVVNICVCGGDVGVEDERSVCEVGEGKRSEREGRMRGCGEGGGLMGGEEKRSEHCFLLCCIECMTPSLTAFVISLM